MSVFSDDYQSASAEFFLAVDQLHQCARAQGEAFFSLAQLLQKEVLQVISSGKDTLDWTPALPPTRESVLEAFTGFRLSIENLREAWERLPEEERKGIRHPLHAEPKEGFLNKKENEEAAQNKKKLADLNFEAAWEYIMNFTKAQPTCHGTHWMGESWVPGVIK